MTNPNEQALYAQQFYNVCSRATALIFELREQRDDVFDPGDLFAGNRQRESERQARRRRSLQKQWKNYFDNFGKIKKYPTIKFVNSVVIYISNVLEIEREKILHETKNEPKDYIREKMNKTVGSIESIIAFLQNIKRKPFIGRNRASGMKRSYSPSKDRDYFEGFRDYIGDIIKAGQLLNAHSDRLANFLDETKASARLAALNRIFIAMIKQKNERYFIPLIIRRGIGLSKQAMRADLVDEWIKRGNELISEGDKSGRLQFGLGLAYAGQNNLLPAGYSPKSVLEFIASLDRSGMLEMNAEFASNIEHGVSFNIAYMAIKSGLDPDDRVDATKYSRFGNMKIRHIFDIAIESAKENNNYYGILWMSAKVAMVFADCVPPKYDDALEILSKSEKYYNENKYVIKLKDVRLLYEATCYVIDNLRRGQKINRVIQQDFQKKFEDLRMPYEFDWFRNKMEKSRLDGG